MLQDLEMLASIPFCEPCVEMIKCVLDDKAQQTAAGVPVLLHAPIHLLCLMAHNVDQQLIPVQRLREALADGILSRLMSLNELTGCQPYIAYVLDRFAALGDPELSAQITAAQGQIVLSGTAAADNSQNSDKSASRKRKAAARFKMMKKMGKMQKAAVERMGANGELDADADDCCSDGEVCVLCHKGGGGDLCLIAMIQTSLVYAGQIHLSSCGHMMHSECSKGWVPFNSSATWRCPACNRLSNNAILSSTVAGSVQAAGSISDSVAWHHSFNSVHVRAAPSSLQAQHAEQMINSLARIRNSARRQQQQRGGALVDTAVFSAAAACACTAAVCELLWREHR